MTRATEGQQDASGWEQTSITSQTTPGAVDLERVLQASLALSSETELGTLMTRMLELVMATSGAARAVLLLRQDEEWVVQARADIATGAHDVMLNRRFDPADGEAEFVPVAVFDHCSRSEDALLVRDARLDRRCAADTMIQRRGIKSVLCIPVTSQGRLEAMVYLEDRQRPEVFTQEHAEVLTYLARQFAVSVQRALLFEDLESKVRDLQRRHERYALAVGGTDAGLWDWDIVTNVLYASERLHELLGFAPDEISITMDWFWDQLHPDDRAATRAALDAHLEHGGPFDLEYRLGTKSGAYRWFHARGQALWDEAGRAVRMSGSITDIEGRKRAEQELQRSEERFRSMMEQSPLAIEILSPEGQITETNSAWAHLWGLADEAEKARLLATYNMLTDPQVAELGIAPLVQRAFAGEPVVLPPIEYSAPRAAAEVGIRAEGLRSPWVQCHLYPVKDEKGDVVYVVNKYMDVSELKRAEREAREQRDTLARVERATRMGQLTGAIAHELSQPLTGILSNAQAAEVMLESERWDRDELATAMNEIAADCKRAGDVIRSLRELYREHKGEFSPVDVNTVVADATQLLRSEMVNRTIEFTTDCAASLPKVNGNRVQIQQVLINLVMNAAQALAELPRRDSRVVRVATGLHGNAVGVWVEDTGPGIDPQTIDRIFEPLATWKPGGTGMGLALSNSIVEAHGGRMWAENKPDGGARVGFVIPALGWG
jgi:two-component system sensor kinase FixL